MAELTEGAYAAGIPRCCSRQTVEEHKAMLLCWGLVAALEAGKKMDCSGCDLRNPSIPSEHEPQTGDKT
jgi:hypothetical protein